MARPLGKIQRGVLSSLVEHGVWYPGCGWLWDTQSHTTRVMESLVTQGLAQQQEREVKQYGRMAKLVTFRPTAEGRTAAQQKV